MKILIIDDNIDKIKKIISNVIKLPSIERDNISTAQSSNDARNILKDNVFDLVILDLNLPYYVDTPESIDVSIELLNDITQDSQYKKPNYIIGLSAFEEMVASASDIFHDNLWAIFHYSDTTNVWVEGTLNCIRYILSNKDKNAPYPPKVDICIITALYDPELKAILELPWDWDNPEPIDDITLVRKGKFTVSGKEYSVVAVSGTRMGMVTSSILSSKLINICRPRFLVMSGICAGIKSKVNLGDAILATTCWDYQSGKRIFSKDSSKFLVSPHQIHVEEFIETRFNDMSYDSLLMSTIKGRWNGNSVQHELRLHTGPVASGSAVLADSTIVQEVIQQERTLLGIEMEIYGLYSAAISSSNIHPVTFAVKSVCDFADEQKHDDFQKYAAYTSAQIIYHFFTRYIQHIDHLA